MLLIRKASRLAARMEVDFSIAHITEPRDKIDPAQLAQFERAARTINAEWIEKEAPDAALALLEVARKRPETVVAIGGTHRTPRWPARNSFARRLLGRRSERADRARAPGRGRAARTGRRDLAR